MKKIVFIVTIILILSLVSCVMPEKYDLLNPISDITEISIVKAYFSDNSELRQSEIAKVNDIDEFMKAFRKIPCYVNIGSPVGLLPNDEEDIVIRISYQNGEYELINWRGQATYTTERDFTYYYGYSVFDEQKFHDLISKYYSETK